VSAHWYHGTLTTPTGSPTAAGPEFTNDFDRLSLYGTLALPRFGPKRLPPLWLLAGYMAGWDKGFNGTAASGTVRSNGVFGELFASVTPMLGAAVRYDWLDPSSRASTNEQQAITGTVNVAALNGLQGILEYRHRLNEGAATNTNLDEARLRIIYIY
jgi:hypothetical protein